MNFRFLAPTQILFGAGTLDQIGALVPGKRALIVCGKGSAIRFGYVNRIATSLERAGKESVLFSGVSPNPRVTEVNTAAELGRAEGVETVIGVGGGSALDAAKAVAVAIKAAKPIDDFFRGEPAVSRIPLLLVPTTAGTGSETSKGAILTDETLGIKNGVRGDGLFADTALVDPTLMLTLPPQITAETGFDIFTHAVETYLSKSSQPLTELLSFEAIRIVARDLKRAVQDGANLEARTNLAYASVLMGINLGNSSTCLPHRMQYPVGALTDTSHPAGLAAIYRAWLRHGFKAAPDQWKRTGTALSDRACGSLDDVYSAYERFLSEIGMDGVTLRSLGVQEGDIPALIGKVSGNLSADPQIVAGHEEETIRQIYSDSL